jgi:hypothetical protein
MYRTSGTENIGVLISSTASGFRATGTGTTIVKPSISTLDGRHKSV